MLVGVHSKMNSTTFNFKTCTDKYVCKINNSTTVRIKRLNPSFAILYFTDISNNTIDIPRDIYVYEYDYLLNSKYKILLQPIHTIQNYVLCGSDSYQIIYKNNCILNIVAQSMWSISST